MEPGKRTRALYLPGGRWVDLWRVARFAGASGRPLGAATPWRAVAR